MPYDAVNRQDPVIRAALAHETATLAAFDAMDVPNREKQLEAFREFNRTVAVLEAITSATACTRSSPA